MTQITPSTTSNALWNSAAADRTVTVRDSAHAIINRTLATIALLLGIFLMGLALWYGILLQQAISSIGDEPAVCDLNAEGLMVCE